MQVGRNSVRFHLFLRFLDILLPVSGFSSPDIRSATQGRATYTMSFSNYAPCEMSGG